MFHVEQKRIKEFFEKCSTWNIKRIENYAAGEPTRINLRFVPGMWIGSRQIQDVSADMLCDSASPSQRTTFPVLANLPRDEAKRAL
jgi:hypothetical protein